MKSNNLSQISLIHPDDINHPTTPVSNMPYDESIEFNNSNYISSENTCESTTDYNVSEVSSEIYDLLPPLPPNDQEKNDEELIEFNHINLGNGKMDYIQNKNVKLMMTNAWKAITQTETWDFVAKDNPSFMFSDDYRVNLISNKMVELGYDGHSGCSFGCTMRNMQFLAKHGEKEFKNLFKNDKPSRRTPSPPLLQRS